MKTKHCSRCDQHVPQIGFAPRVQSRDGLNSWCKSCVSDAKKAWRLANPDRARTHQKKCREKARALAQRRELERQRVRAWKQANPQRVRQHARQAQEQLHDWLVSARIRQGTSLRPEDIPAELIEMKREQLKTQRSLASLKLAIQGDSK